MDVGGRRQQKTVTLRTRFRTEYYIEFWFDTIHCHRTEDLSVNEAYNKHIDPPIIIVFTGMDKYEMNNLEKKTIEDRQWELQSQIGMVFGEKSKYHLRKIFFLSNKTSLDDKFEDLQQEISKSAMKMRNWGERMPLKWILLEHLIEINKKNGKNFINISDMISMAKHRDIEMPDVKDVVVFLRFQHEVGNIIFFADMVDFIILNPQWLVDAFRCIVSDKFDSRLQCLCDWQNFQLKGKISESLIMELFRSKSDFLAQKKHLLLVMQNFDILVRIDKTDVYIVPSMIPSSTFEEVCQNNLVYDPSCKRSSWLCLKFEFLPPAFYNHFTVWFIRTYIQVALFRGICIFDIDESGCAQLLVVMSTDTIALQLLSFSTDEKDFGSMFSNIRKDLIERTEAIKSRYKLTISYKIHFKCSTGLYYKDTKSFEDLKKFKDYRCMEHKAIHKSKDLYLNWMMDVDEDKKISNNEASKSSPRNTMDTIGLDHKQSELDNVLDSVWHKAFRSIRVKILKNLANPDNVAKYLFRAGIFTREILEIVQDEHEIKEKTKLFLDTLGRRGHNSVKCLYNAFQQTNNGSLADLLKPYARILYNKEDLNDPTEWPPDGTEQKQMENDAVSNIKDIKSVLMHFYSKEDVYRLHGEKRGKVFMIDNTFSHTKHQRREGSVFDVNTLSDLFQQLHFDVLRKNNLPAETMVRYLEKERDSITDWKNIGCIVLILISHVEGQYICGIDNIPIKLTDIIEVFDTEHCYGLDGKPRLVFVQASGKAQNPFEKQEVHPKPGYQLELVDVPNIKPIEVKHPPVDFLVVCSTPEGTTPYSNNHTEAWFLNAVVWTFKYHAKHEELHHLLTRVNRLVVRGRIKNTNGKKITVSEVHTNLRKKFYFFPGVYGDHPKIFKE